MIDIRSLLVAVSVLMLAGSLRSQQLTVTMSEAPDPCPLFGVYEIQLDHSASYTNPFTDVTVSVTFTSPNFGTKAVQGYYHASAQWRVRFCPDAPGTWTWSLSMTSGLGTYAVNGNVTVAATTSQRGALIRYPASAYRLVRQDGRYSPIIGSQRAGIIPAQVCLGSDSTQNINTVGIADYLNVMAGDEEPWTFHEEFDSTTQWPAPPTTPGPGVASWSYSISSPGTYQFSGSWIGNYFGLRTANGLDHAISGTTRQCMVADLGLNAGGNAIETPQFTISDASTIAFWASVRMTIDSGTQGTPSHGFTFTVTVEKQVSGGSWQTAATFDVNSFTGWNWNYKEFLFPLAAGAWKLRWTVSNVQMPQNKQFFLTSVDGIRIRPPAASTSTAINTTRRIFKIPGDVMHINNPLGAPYHLKYLLDRAHELDEEFALYKERNIALILCINNKLGGSWSSHPFNSANGGPVSVNSSSLLYDTANSDAISAYKKYITYIVSRWGAYADMWELFNEVYSNANGLTGAWFTDMANHLASVDPYDRLVTTSYPQPTETWNDCYSPHEYTESSVSDTQFAAHIASITNQSYGKPVVFEELGNRNSLTNNTPVRIRTGLWSAYFNNGGFVLWDDQSVITTPVSPSSANANAFLGVELRAYIKHFAAITAAMPIDMAPIDTAVTYLSLSNSQHSAWGLYSAATKQYAWYVHDGQDHTTSTSGDTITFDVKNDTYYYDWYNVATGQVVANGTTSGSRVTLTMPSIQTDLLVRLHHGSDSAAPSLAQVIALNPTSVRVRFDERIGMNEALLRANYSIVDEFSTNVPITAITFGDDGRSVTLILGSSLVANTAYTLLVLTAYPIKDMSEPPNAMTAQQGVDLAYNGSQEVTIVPTGLVDSYIDVATAGSGYYAKGNGGDISYLAIQESDVKRALVYFALPQEVLGKTIDSAYLTLYCFDSSEYPPAQQSVYAYPLTRLWTEGTKTWLGDWADGATWRAYQVWNPGPSGVEQQWTTFGGDYSSTASASVTVATLNEYYDFDLTSLVHVWANADDDAVINKGVMLIGQELANKGKYFFSSEYLGNPTLRPRVTITYH